jgi:hypothetical protein
VIAPPRLWAITPPEGDLDPAVVLAWRPWTLAVWLRWPGASPDATWARTADLATVAMAEGHAVVLGCAADDLEAAAARVARHRLAGIVLRGDPSRQALERARERLGPEAWIGRSIHGPAPDHDRCTVSVLGPVFAPHTAKPWATTALGTDALARVAAVPHARIVAVGGIDATTAAACVAAGAWGLAGIRSFFGPAARVAQDVAALGRAWSTATRGPQHP